MVGFCQFTIGILILAIEITKLVIYNNSFQFKLKTCHCKWIFDTSTYTEQHVGLSLLILIVKNKTKELTLY